MLSATPLAAALAPGDTEEPVNVIFELTPTVLVVGVAEDCSILDRLHELVLVGIRIRERLFHLGLGLSSLLLRALLSYRENFLDQ